MTERYLTGPQICSRFSITAMTLNRWQRRPEMGFPQPLKINNRRYWPEADVIAWERSRAAGRAAA